MHKQTDQMQLNILPKSENPLNNNNNKKGHDMYKQA